MNKENKKTIYSFNATGTIVEWVILGFALYGLFLFATDLINYLSKYYN